MDFEKMKDNIGVCYPLGDFKTRAVLVPHASVYESVCGIMVGLHYLDKNKPLCIVGTNHHRIKIKSDWEYMKEDVDEHSFKVIAEIAKKAYGYVNSDYLFVDGNGSIDNILEHLKDKSESHNLVFTSDLTHYKEISNEVIKNEEKLIQDILDHNVIKKKKYPDVNACGYDEINVFSKYSEKYETQVAFYTGSNAMRIKWDNKKGKKFVSYLTCITYEGYYMPIYHYQMMLSYSRSVFYNLINGGDDDIFMPKWCIGWEMANGCFVTLRQNGVVIACIGHLENGRSLIENIKLSTLKLRSDAEKRFNIKIDPEKIDSIIFQLSILENKTNWINFNPSVQSSDHYGFQISENGKSAIYLPDVWVENFKNSPIETVIESLAKKAGFSDIKNSNIKMFKTIDVNTCVPDKS